MAQQSPQFYVGTGQSNVHQCWLQDCREEEPKGPAAPAGSAIAGQLMAQGLVQARGDPDPHQEISLISSLTVLSISEIELIGTDTTLDLSQKAEKVCHLWGPSGPR